jgi:ABC-type transport system involved in multi-copper enzyme maturation permease subunit
MRAMLTVAGITLREAGRRRILLAALVCGAAFVALFAIGFHHILKGMPARVARNLLGRRMVLTFFTLAGLYATNFLAIMTAVLLPVDTVSGEIASGVMQTLASKPVRRSEILLGKWLAFVSIAIGYLALLAGGVLLTARLESGALPPRLELGLPLMALEVCVLVTPSILGGTRFGTVTSGVVVFGLYGLAFIGSWVEQIGTIAGNEAARTIGTVASLIMPSEAMWQLAAHHMQPPLMSQLQMTPFSPASVPSPAMVMWAAGYVVVALVAALVQFSRRSL